MNSEDFQILGYKYLVEMVMEIQEQKTIPLQYLEDKVDYMYQNFTGPYLLSEYADEYLDLIIKRVQRPPDRSDSVRLIIMLNDLRPEYIYYENFIYFYKIMNSITTEYFSVKLYINLDGNIIRYFIKDELLNTVIGGMSQEFNTDD